MKGIFINVVIIITCKFSSCCEENGYDKCQTNHECCSGYCDRPSEMEHGVCQTACGITYKPLVLQAKIAEYGEFPWHAGIYKYNKTNGLFSLLCGGTLISSKAVISAAHCFSREHNKTGRIVNLKYWNLKVAVGKLYQGFEATEDDSAQIVNVNDIEILQQFKGSQDYFANNIAILTLATDIKFTNTAKPVCVDFGLEEPRKGTLGKVPGWGITIHEKFDEKLKVMEIPFVPKENCEREISSVLIDYVTDDKLCAGDKYSNASLCKGDSGTGLVFKDQATKTYYLYGVFGLHDKKCEGGEYALFTKLSTHEEFVQKYLADCEECKENCGKPISDSPERGLSKEKQPDYELFPWHAVLYQFNEDKNAYDQICGGTLISRKIVLSAAICVQEEGMEPDSELISKNTEIFKIALGKRYRALHALQDSSAQIFDVDNIDILLNDRRYRNHEKIMALIILKTEVQFTRAVRPICFDIATDISEEKNIGSELKIVSWAEKASTNALKIINMPIVEEEKCMTVIRLTSTSTMWNDGSFFGICVGDASSNGKICTRDNGGGLVFQDLETKKYYLHGVVILDSDQQCKKENQTLFPSLLNENHRLEAYVDFGCRPLTSAKLNIFCFAPDGKSTHCDNYLPNNSTATFSCRPSVSMKVKEPEYSKITCIKDDWDRPLIDDFCDIPCGISELKTEPTISVPKPTQHGEFPWHATIYEYNADTDFYDIICGGTLISHKALVTAAGCVVHEKLIDDSLERAVKNKKNFKIALGKYYRALDVTESNEAQIFDVENIEVPTEYENSFEALAFVTLTKSVKFNRAVRPACVDISEGTFEEEVTKELIMGTTVGWGKESQSLNMIEMPIFPSYECVKIKDKLGFIGDDVICAGDMKSNESVCTADIGSGLVIEDPDTQAYILLGVFRFASKDCKNYAIFSKMSSYKNLFDKYLQSCKGACKRTCGISFKNSAKVNDLQLSNNEEFPWRAGIYEYNPSTGSYDHVCGGTVITQKIVVSAAQCIGNKNKSITEEDLEILRVALGKLNWALDGSPGPETQIFEVYKVEVSPEYKGAAGFYENDVAFIILEGRADFSTKYIQPVCYRHIQVGEEPIGRAVSREIKFQPDFSGKQKIIEMQFVPPNQCETEINDGKTHRMIDTLCSKNESSNESRIQIDNGEGVVFEKAKQHYLSGVFHSANSSKSLSFFSRVRFSKRLFYNYPPTCASKDCDKTCGKSVSNLPPTKVSHTELGQYPWHAGIYQFNAVTTEYDHICGGTLITRKIVISAAKCFSTDLDRPDTVVVKDLQTFKVGLGKFYRGLHTPQDDLSQIADVENVELVVHKSSTSKTKRKRLDYLGIAFIILKTEIEYTTAVRPICVEIDQTPKNYYEDYKNYIEDASRDRNSFFSVLSSDNFDGEFMNTRYENDRDNFKKSLKDSFEDNLEENNLVEGAMGKIVNWKSAATEPDVDDTLKVAEMPLLSMIECFEIAFGTLSTEAGFDQICAEDKSTNMTISKNDLGGGLFLRDEETKAHYLYGILVFYREDCQRRSAWQDTNMPCAVFARISTFRTDVKKYISLNDNDREGFSQRKCGRSVSNLFLPTVSPSNQGEFPWLAGIYQCDESNGSCNQICSGTLISRKVVISAAHCFTKEEKPGIFNLTDFSTLKVAIGNRYRSFRPSTDSLVQIADVENIDISPNYRGSATFYANDIAFLLLKSEVKYNEAVRPVCVDTGEDFFEEENLRKRPVGKMAIWGNETNASKLMKIPLVPREECVRKIDSELLLSVSSDKVCAGDKSPGVTLCRNDNGGGLIFKDPRTERHVLRGILSLGANDCKGEDYFLFTKVSSHKEFVRKYVQYCEGLCRPNQCELTPSKKLQTVCFGPTGKSIRCDKPLPNNSKVTFICNLSNYETIKKAQYNSITCRNGQWDRPLVDDFCDAACGKSLPNLKNHRPIIIDGKQTYYGEFPWHAGLYQYNTSTGDYEQICGGTLISYRIVITAAHCVTEEKIKNRTVFVKKSSTFIIALGKYYRTLNSSEDSLAQIIKVKNIEIPSQYKGHLNLYDNDIAFITLRKKVEYITAVRPICLDIGDDNFEKEQLKKGSVGKVVGWGLTSDGIASENLTLAEMPFVPREECTDQISNSLISFASRDKIICAGNKSASVTVCQGDSGGGLVFEDTATKVYYLRGVVSLGPKGCRNDFALFTKLSPYRSLIEKLLQVP